jgi:hypothetical protein
MINATFLQSGFAIFTVSRGEFYRTFLVKKVTEGPLEGQYFAKVLVGPNNTDEGCYRYLGRVEFGRDIGLRLTSGSKYDANSKEFLCLDWTFRLISSGRETPQDVKVEHCGYCARCGLVLTTPESIRIGIGPVCLKKVHASLAAEKVKREELVPVGPAPY